MQRNVRWVWIGLSFAVAGCGFGAYVASDLNRRGADHSFAVVLPFVALAGGIAAGVVALVLRIFFGSVPNEPTTPGLVERPARSLLGAYIDFRKWLALITFSIMGPFMLGRAIWTLGGIWLSGVGWAGAPEKDQTDVLLGVIFGPIMCILAVVFGMLMRRGRDRGRP